MKNISLNVFKLATIFGLVVCFGFKIPQQIVPEQIDWDTHFLAEPDVNSAFAALTVTTWHYDYKASVRNGNLHIDFNFNGGVDPNKSWVKRNRIRDRKISRQLLNHEQGHVYINFLLLKNSDAAIRNQKYNQYNYKRLIQFYANRISDYYNAMQDRYDDETQHGANLEAQDRWNDFIANEMDKIPTR